MRIGNQTLQRMIRASVLAAAVAAVPLGARGEDSPNMVTWSISGSTAMRNFTISGGFSVLEAGSPTLTLSNGTYTAGTNGLQFAPSVFTGSAIVGSFSASASGAGVRIEWHEQGSVEGILEMVNDQVGYDGGLLGTPLIDPASRNPTNANPIRINRNNATLSSNLNGYNISNSAYNTYDPANYNAAGRNLFGGQNRVQMAISDVKAVQGFSKTNGTSAPLGTPVWGLAPGNSGYGKGNAALSSGTTSGLGFGGARQQLVDDSVLNMSESRINPATGANYSNGTWNTAAVDNLVNKTVAVTATVLAANPGTGLTQINKTDAQWLQVAGRLQNGADFNVAQRDVNSGTRNVFALNTGVDPTWAVGENDDGNGNTGNLIGTAAEQASIGSKLRFSGKTAGGGQLRPTIQNSRMALGPLGMSDAIGSVKNNANPNPLRALAYSNTTTDTGANFVAATAASITDGSYVIWQQEQYVTIRTPDANYGNDDSIKGDPNGDIAKLRNNILNSVNATFPNQVTLNTPADQLLNQSFILPQMMLVAKEVDGGATSNVASVVVNSKTHAQWRQDLLNDPSLPLAFNTAPAVNVTAGSNSLYGVAPSANGLAAGNSGTVLITAQDSSGNSTGASAAPKGNYLFGNFNQNGVRDYSAVMAAQVAQAKLFAAGETVLAGSGTNASNVNAGTIIGSTLSLHNNTKITSLAGVSPFNTALDSMNGGTGPTKGDLIVLGDFNGDGFFNGKDLYQMAHGAAIADSTLSTSLTATAANFGDKLRGGVLRKNAALDAMQNATAPLNVDDGLNAARAYQRATAAVNSADPTAVANAFNKFDVNRDGKVNRIDASIVDHFVGNDYRNLTNQVNAVIATNGTVFDGLDANGKLIAETAKPISLVDPELDDSGDITYALVGGTSDFKKIRDAVGGNLIDGDANFDGIVDIKDLAVLATHWQGAADRWSSADFNFDGVVTAIDLGFIATNWQSTSGALGPQLGFGAALSALGLNNVPEPASIALIGLVGASTLGRRRRRAK